MWQSRINVRKSQIGARYWSLGRDGFCVSDYLKKTAIKYIEDDIIQHWKPSEIEQVIIPKLPMPIQETISAKIQESFALKTESKRLLEEAKMMVEREIEKGVRK